jgi:hypothetical protein
MKQYCYVVVRMDVTKCPTRVLAQSADDREPPRWDEHTLQRLLRSGWVPLREMSMGHGHALILLEKDTPAGPPILEAVAAVAAQEN